MISLDSFITLKKLSVKNIRIEPKKIRGEYRIEKFSGEESSIELIYSYEEKYFDKNDPGDINLASMMIAQIAVNYGLFFETIEFEGSYDAEDRKFILNMIENTAREIITNKLLIENEFLVPPFDTLKIEKSENYSGAEIIFSGNSESKTGRKRGNAPFDHNKYSILSSGGKDSLLTYGIIKEIGIPYPVFINEAGRHWFTAVNAYRYMKENEPNTKKPWCNSDRVFNFILRHLPFIREDYAKLRSDIYPVRLWTVAVFLFGVLPVVLKNGIGNILIGDEYDTTVKGEKSGISHYNGLYDQSRFFDNMMTRYYHKKGWDINQFSLLRSLSELLIMRVLLKGYPDLQRHQISCHAARSERGRIYPCGQCEKCRRIIGMIKALDEEPGRCGYSEEQVKQGLTSLKEQSVKQIKSDASHLYYLLVQKGIIDKTEHVVKMGKEHSEILKLRFDNERSMIEDIPKYIRKPLFDILTEYSDGVVLKEGKQWREIKMDKKFLDSYEYKAGGK